jgi:hypothetical protein
MDKWKLALHVLFNVSIAGMKAVTLSYEWIVSK